MSMRVLKSDGIFEEVGKARALWLTVYMTGCFISFYLILCRVRPRAFVLCYCAVCTYEIRDFSSYAAGDKNMPVLHHLLEFLVTASLCL